MPRGDRTGPAGMGPMTGRAAGFCAGYSVPGFMNPVGGRGFARGGGRGYRNWYWATGLPGWQRARMGLPSVYGPAWGAPVGAPPPAYPGWEAYPGAQYTADQEKDYLKKHVDFLEEQTREARQRLDELEKEEEPS